MVETASPDEVIARLAALYRRNGYIRWLKPDRRAREGPFYKKGDELRLVANSDRELRTIRRLLRLAGFVPVRAFRKAKLIRDRGRSNRTKRMKA